MAEEIRKFNRYDRKFPDDWKCPNFGPFEFSCHDGSQTVLISKLLVQRLQAGREFLGVPIYISSGYRTKAYNSKIAGSASDSQHIYGRASDMSIKGYDAGCVQRGMSIYWFSNGGVGYYKWGTHVDTWTKRRWGTLQPTTQVFPNPFETKPLQPVEPKPEWKPTINDIPMDNAKLLEENIALKKREEELLIHQVEDDKEIAYWKDMVTKLNEESKQTFNTKLMNKLYAFFTSFKWNKFNLKSGLRSAGISMVLALITLLDSKQILEWLKDYPALIAVYPTLHIILNNWFKNFIAKMQSNAELNK